MNKSRILLIGLGPHSKRIYIRALRKLELEPILIIDIESQKENILSYLKEHNIKAETYFIPSEEKDFENLSATVVLHLDQLIHSLRITHAIISTEPKAHYAYLQYLISRKITTLTDKPITSPAQVCNNPEQALLIKKQFNHLINLIDQYKTNVVVQCQRRYDQRYIWIKSIITDFMKRYEIPVHNIQIFHSDGSFYTPDDILMRENHPYKFGYGKIFHSGYHFIDLMNMMLSWENLPENKRPDSYNHMSMHFDPHDQLFSMDQQFYNKLFPEKSYEKEFDQWKAGKYKNLGEIDYSGLIQFTKESIVLSTGVINLMNSGFSRRAWSKQAKDTYKGNGRVKHETMYLNLGPFLSIQVHSYQSSEIKDRDNPQYNHQSVGGLDHYQIYIFRNPDLIGGKPCEVIEGQNLFSSDIENDPYFIGYNEKAKDNCINEFSIGKYDKSPLSSHKNTIEMICSAYLNISNERNGKIPYMHVSL